MNPQPVSLADELRKLADDLNCQMTPGDGYTAHIEKKCPRCRLLALLDQYAVAEPQKWTCPDCGYDSMPYPPKDYHICPKCMVEFGVDDRKSLHIASQQQQVREALLTCVRDISKLQDLLRERHGKGFTIPLSTGKLRAENVLHLLTSPVAPPPQRDKMECWMAARDWCNRWTVSMTAIDSLAELLMEFQLGKPPVAPPPQKLTLTDKLLEELKAMPELWRTFSARADGVNESRAYRACADRLDGWLFEAEPEDAPPVAPPPQTSQAYPGQKYFHDHNANIKRAELNAAPPVAPGEQPSPTKKEEIMKSADLMQTTDHVIWAKEFVQRYGGDEELMASWFASAMMAMHDKMHGPPNGDAMQYKLDQRKPPGEPAKKCVYCGELQPEKLSAAGIIEAIEGKVEQRELNDLLASIEPPPLAGEQPPREIIICEKCHLSGYVGAPCTRCGHIIGNEPAQQRVSDERERPIMEMPMVTPEQALESLNEFTRFWHRIGGDQGDAPDAHLTRRFIKQQTDALATAAKQAREEALELAVKAARDSLFRWKTSTVKWREYDAADIEADIRGTFAAQPSPRRERP